MDQAVKPDPAPGPGQPSAGPGPTPFGRGLSRLTRTVSAIGSLMIVGLMVAINADVGGRYLFNHPVPGTAEVISASIVSIVFLQLPDCIRSDRMIRSGVLIDRLLLTRPRLGEAMEVIFSLTGLVMTCILLRYLVPAVHKAWAAYHMIGVPGIFQAPIWPFYLLVVIGAALAVVEYGRAILVHLQRYRAERQP